MKKRRIVIKLGSTTLTRGTDKISRGKLEDIARQINDLNDQNEIVIVTSGAIAAAKHYIELNRGKRGVDSGMAAPVGSKSIVADVHDVGDYKIADEWRVPEPGMVLTIEPGIYVSPDDLSVAKKWRGIGIRIEDDVAVTRGGRQVLSDAAPKALADIEQLMAECR